MDILENSDPAPTCRRCGACCLKGGPALHAEDLPLFAEQGPLGLAHVVTLRAGEPAFDQLRGEVRPLAAELLKLRGTGSAWTCTLYDHETRACTLYEARPAECRALDCRDASALAAMYEVNRLTRKDFFASGHGLLAVMAEHDALVPAGRIQSLARALRAGGQDALDAGETLVRMALADLAFRKALAERAGVAPDVHDFFLGRDAAALFAAAGLHLRADARNGLRVQPDPLWREA
jgi:Fe-S-cluster containining protein